MKYIILAVMLCGCGNFQRWESGMTGGLSYRCSRSGVEYVQSESGLATHVDVNGNPVVCLGGR